MFKHFNDQMWYIIYNFKGLILKLIILIISDGKTIFSTTIIY